LIIHVGPDDPRLDPYRHVGDPQWLIERGLFVAEGRLVVERLADLGRFDVESVLMTPTSARALEPRLNPGWPLLVADQSVVHSVTGFNFHRGCLALVRRPVTASHDDWRRGQRLVLLEGVGNPDNIGGIFRSALAFGADAILLDRTSADPFYRKAVRTSMAAVLQVPSLRVDEWLPTIARLRGDGLVVAALTPAGDVSLEDFAAGQPRAARIALVAGAEGSGLPPATIAAADVSVAIPVNPLSDSLNVVVAVSIALERLRR
jgi:tRNA G18 (ribose-2'-O)-methylase SpoU